MLNTDRQIDIIIADNQYLIIEALKGILKSPYAVQAIAHSKIDILSALQEVPNGFLFLDYSLLDFDGYKDLNEIKARYPLTIVIILMNSITRHELFEFNNIGIKNILDKNLDEEELFLCLEAAQKRRKFYSGSILDLMLDINDGKSNLKNTVQLTTTEIGIVRLIAQGLTTKEIANQKCISFHTAMTHRKNILRKLDVSNASELVMSAIRKGFIDTIEYHI